MGRSSNNDTSEAIGRPPEHGNATVTREKNPHEKGISGCVTVSAQSRPLTSGSLGRLLTLLIKSSGSEEGPCWTSICG